MNEPVVNEPEQKQGNDTLASLVGLTGLSAMVVSIGQISWWLSLFVVGLFGLILGVGMVRS